MQAGIPGFVFFLLTFRAYGQELLANLPDSPQPQSQSLPPASSATEQSELEQRGRGTVSGTVLDTNGNVIQGARVQLSKAGTPGIFREMNSDGTGGFEFAGLAPGSYTIAVTAADMGAFQSQPIALSADQTFVVPKVVLPVAGTSTSVTVLDEKEASIEQVRIAEQQRVFGVFPNFYSSFDKNAPPMLAKEKYHLAARTLIDPVSFGAVAGIAAVEQYKNVFPSFGGGMEGYWKRYGTAYANHASAEIFTRAVFPSIFHDDPRYFVMGSGSTRERAAHAAISTFVTRGDDGRRKPNYSEILGKLCSASLSNAYFPEEERGAQLVLINGLGAVGANIVDNLIREFVFGRLTSRAARRQP